MRNLCLLTVLLLTSVAHAAEPLIHVDAPQGATGQWPVRTGVPFAQGDWPVTRRAAVVAPDGRTLPSQSKVLTTWRGGEYAKFLLVTFEADLAQRGPYRLVEASIAEPLAQTDGAGNIMIDTGKVAFTIPAIGGGIFMSEKWLTEPVRLRVVDHNDVAYRSGDHERSVTLEENGPYAAVARVSGWYESDAGDKLNLYIVRIYAYRDSNVVRVLHTFINTGHAENYRYKEIAMDVPGLAYGPSREETIPDEERAHVVCVRTDSRTIKAWMDVAGKPRQDFEIDAMPQPLDLTPARTRFVDERQPEFTVLVRDFERQFPCGYEVMRNGETRIQFWSPHQPRLFDLRPMPFIAGHAPRAEKMYRTQAPTINRAHEIIPELGGTLAPSGIGMGKSHELFFSFQPTRHDIRIPDPHRDTLPYAYVDPHYACATGALQPMFPKTAGRFTEIEKLLDDYIDGFYAKREQKTPYYDDSYGYFNFGDVKRQSGTSFHRYWMHAFYSLPRSFWYLYFRCGDRRIRDLAMQNSRHIMDLDTGHYTDPDNERSRAGGTTNDDSGLFHHDGYRPQNDNTEDYVDYMVYMHQITGDERAKEVALEVAAASKWLFARRTPGWAHRATGQGLKQMVSLYELTWDEGVRAIADHFAKQVIDNVRDGVTTGYSGSAPGDFTLAYIFPGAIAYHRLTGDDAMRDWIVSNADFLAKNNNLGHAAHFPKWDGLAYANLLTGERRYIDPAWRALRDWAQNDNDPAADWAGVCFGLSKAPMVLEAASRYDAPPAPVGKPLVSISEVVLRHDGKSPRVVSAVVFGPYRATFDNQPEIILRGPDGDVVARRAYPGDAFDKWYADGGWVETFALSEKHPAGVYRVQLSGMPDPPASDVPFVHDTSMLPAWLSVTADGPMPMMAKLEPNGLPPGGRYGHGTQYFHVDSERIAIGIQQVGYHRRVEVKLVDPDGNVAASTKFADYEPMQWITLEADVPAQHRGKIWTLEIPRIDEVYRLRFEGAPPYVTDEASRVIALPWQ